ncbi:MAG: hypothetical protein M1815_000690 [Lichina confinis]|nr:MAG: hypothetical protein M1815_000690 [Lichina confinis]
MRPLNALVATLGLIGQLAAASPRVVERRQTEDGGGDVPKRPVPDWRSYVVTFGGGILFGSAGLAAAQRVVQQRSRGAGMTFFWVGSTASEVTVNTLWRRTFPRRSVSLEPQTESRSPR